MTEFAQKVYAVLRSIPRGKVATYHDVAVLVGLPRAARAVGTALARNEQLVTIPCHRVVRTTGEVGQYARGQAAKIALLKEEGVPVIQGRVDLSTYRYVYDQKN